MKTKGDDKPLDSATVEQVLRCAEENLLAAWFAGDIAPPAPEGVQVHLDATLENWRLVLAFPPSVVRLALRKFEGEQRVEAGRKVNPVWLLGMALDEVIGP